MEPGARGVRQTTRADVHSSGPDFEVRHPEFDFLPAVDVAVEGPGFQIRGRRGAILHVADDADGVGRGFHFHVGVDVDAGVAADGAHVDVAQVTQVEQVVVDELGPTLERERVRHRRPLGVGTTNRGRSLR